MRMPYAFRVADYRSMGGDHHASRSTVYALHRSLSLLGELNHRGLVGDDYRDTITGRKVRSIVLELSRLIDPSETNPDSWPDGLADRLVETYLTLRDKPLAEVREICRQARQ